MERVNIGLIGVGGYGRVHRQAIRAAEEHGLARLAAAVILPGLEPETENELRARGVLIYRSHQEMLARAPREAEGGLELVGVPCGIGEHAPLSIAALRAGFHVLCEKPAAGNLADALEMQRAARQARKIMAIGYQNMYTPPLRRIKELTLEGRRGGRLGRLLEAKSSSLWPRDSAYYGRNAWAGRLAVGGRPIYDSPAQNATAHYLQDLLYVAGPDEASSATPVRLYGENYRAKDIESADTQFLRISTREGPTLTYMVTHACTEMRGPVTEFSYEGGAIRWWTERGLGVMELRYGAPGGAAAAAPVAERVDSGPRDAHELPYEGVIQAIRGGPPPKATIDNCLQHTACIDALFSRCELVAIPREHTRTETGATVVTHLPGIDELMQRMYDRKQSFHEAGAPWARAGREVEL
jgi:predicted dehydrogenase